MAAKQPSTVFPPIWCSPHCLFLTIPPLPTYFHLCFPRPPALPSVPYQVGSCCAASSIQLPETPKLMKERGRSHMEKKKELDGNKESKTPSSLAITLAETKTPLEGPALLILTLKRTGCIFTQSLPCTRWACGVTDPQCLSFLLQVHLCPSKVDILKSQPPVPQNVTFFGNSIFTEVIKLK